MKVGLKVNAWQQGASWPSSGPAVLFAVPSPLVGRIGGTVRREPLPADGQDSASVGPSSSLEKFPPLSELKLGQRLILTFALLD